MGTVRVFELEDGSLRVLTPAGDASLDDSAAAAIAADPTLADLPYVDVDAESLPDRAVRYAWRLQDDVVIVDPAVLSPTDESDLASADFDTNYNAAVTRLDQIAGASNFTLAQAAAAVQDEARILKRLCRVVYARLA